jgi:PIN domain nuclease of toxin-antitoxin system
MSGFDSRPRLSHKSVNRGWHRDPFDRMLIAQAQIEDLAILTTDRRFKQYDVKVIA